MRMQPCKKKRQTRLTGWEADRRDRDRNQSAPVSAAGRKPVKRNWYDWLWRTDGCWWIARNGAVVEHGCIRPRLAWSGQSNEELSRGLSANRRWWQIPQFSWSC